MNAVVTANEPAVTNPDSTVEETNEPTTEQPLGEDPSLPNDPVAKLQQAYDISQAEGNLRIDWYNTEIPVIPLNEAEQEAATRFEETPDNAPKATDLAIQTIENATVALVSNGRHGSGTFVGISEDRDTILLLTGVHSLVDYLEIEPGTSSQDDMIARAKKEIEGRLNKSQGSSGFEMEGFNVEDVKFIAVTGADGSEQVLIEVKLENEPPEGSITALPMAPTEEVLHRDSRIITAGYPYITDEERLEPFTTSLSGRVYSDESGAIMETETRVANENTPNDKTDDKTYNKTYLLTNTEGILPGTSGGGVITLDSEGNPIVVGIITAKGNDGRGWASANDEILIEKVKNWNETY